MTLSRRTGPIRLRLRLAAAGNGKAAAALAEKLKPFGRID
jgi:hypothetical protein